MRRAIAGTPFAIPSFVLFQATCRTVAGGGGIAIPDTDFKTGNRERQMPSITRSERKT